MSDCSATHATPRGLWTRRPLSGDIVLVAVAVGLFTIFGMALAQSAGRVATIWPANGLLLALLLRSPSAKWPGYALAGALAGLAGGLVTGYPLDICLRLTVVNAFEIATAMVLIRRFVGMECELSQPRNLWRFALAAAVCAPALAMVLKAGLASLATDAPWSPGGLATSFLAHSLGIVTVAPITLALRRRTILKMLALRTDWAAILPFATLVATTVLVFAQSRYPLLFLVQPPLVFIVCRHGLAGGSLGLLLAAILAISLTVMGYGPTAIIPGSSTMERVICVQLFAAINGGFILALSALLAERDRAKQDLVSTRDELMRLATTDGLTGLLNRRRLDDALDEECRRAARIGTPLSLLMIDVDRFKAFNDRYGHQGGDACLRAISSAIKTFGRRPGDIVARYGGEELALLLPATPERGALILAEGIRAAVAGLAIPHGGNLGCGGVVTVSIGLATAGVHGLDYDPEALIGAADSLLYEAKRTGRNAVMSPSLAPADPVPPVLADEERRLEVVEAFWPIAGERRSVDLDALAKHAADLLGSPIGLVSLVGRDRQVFVGRYGLAVEGTARDVSFCAHTMTRDDPLFVADASKDPRFKDNALVTGELNLRFYAGAPMMTEAAQRLGAVCVIDRVAHAPPTSAQRDELAKLASRAVRLVEQKGPSVAAATGDELRDSERRPAAAVCA